MKLKAGDVITVFGFVMLKGLDPGVYRVSKVTPHYKQDTYTFTRKAGHKPVCRHYSDSVDAWIRSAGNPDLNKIEIGEG